MRIGIDLGGTKIEIAVLDAGGNIRLRRRAPTPKGDYQGIIDTIRTLVQNAEAELDSGRVSVGVGIPGTISPATGLIKNANSVCLIGHALDEDLGVALGRPVRLANDANCFALSEAKDGAAAGARVVFGVIIGTGTGGGIVVDGKVLTGRNSIAGEWGHNPLPWPHAEELPGRPCYCGNTGCIETFLSGPGLQATFAELGGPPLLAAQIAQRAQMGEPLAVQTMDIYTDRLARSLATVVNLLDPDIIVLGGGVSNIESLYDTVPALLRKYVFSDDVSTQIIRAKHGDSSGVRGAAWLWDLSSQDPMPDRPRQSSRT